MAEVSFAKQFLASLDSRSVKLSSDYVADPRQLPAHSAYILPKNPKPYTKPTQQAAAADPGSSSAAPTAATVTLKTVRPSAGAPASLELAAQPLQSSIYDLKALAGRRAGFAPDKIKILWDKRPAADSKTLGEVVGAAAAGGAVEMSVMFVGAPTAKPDAADEEAAGVANADAAALAAAKAKDVGNAGGAGRDADSKGMAQGKSGWEVCETEEFWQDLGDFVMQRIRDEDVARRLVESFRESWKGSR